MKSIKRVFLAVMMFSLAVPAMADNQVIDGLIGAVIGGGAGRFAGRNTTVAKRNMITAAGALGGAWMGSNIGDDSGKRHRETLQSQSDNTERQIESRGYSQNVRQVSYEQAPSRQVVEYVDEPVQQRRQVVRQSRAAQVIDSCADEDIYNGEYDPEAAQAFCAGVKERQRQASVRSQKDKERMIRMAYRAGLEGQ